MKKFSLFALAFITSTAMFAQIENRTEMAVKPRFGIKAGANLSKLRPNDLPSGFDLSTNLKTSFHVGLLANIPLGTGGLAFQPEVLYSGQGSKMNQKTTVGTITTSEKYEQDLHYINVPLMFQFKTVGGFYVEAGPQVGFLINAKQDGPGDVEVDNKDSFENMEVSAGAGLGYMTRVGLGIGARYNHGFSNVLDNESSSDASLKHSVINIGLFYHFGANK